LAQDILAPSLPQAASSDRLARSGSLAFGGRHKVEYGSEPLQVWPLKDM